MNAEDEKETPGEYRVKYTEEELKTSFTTNCVINILRLLKQNTQRLWAI